jgi:hypothetical protein
MKSLFGKEYHDKLKWYMEKIDSHAETRNLDTLKAVLELCEMPSVKENGMAVVLFMAAAVEILEPSA